MRKRPTSVTVIGWIFILSAIYKLFTAGTGFLTFAALQQMKMTSFPQSQIPLPVLKLMLFNFQPPFLILQIAGAIFVLLAAIQLLKLRPWSRKGLEIFSWGYAVYTFGSGILFFIAFMTYVWGHPTPGADFNLPPMVKSFGMVAGALNTAIWALPTLIIIYFLRRPNVREAFKPDAGPPGISQG